MKVVHSFVDNYNVLWKEVAYSQYLSALLAKKHYGNITFYSTPEIVELVKEIGIPYDEYNSTLLTLSDFDTWSIPKIKVFKELKESFLHIDNDTFIFNKIDFKKYNKPFLFSHPDLGVDNIVKSFSVIFNGIINTLNGKKETTDEYYYHINNSYLRLFLKLMNKFSPDFLKSFDLGSIPNMNIVYVQDYKTFNTAASSALDHYYREKETIDKEEYGPCYIEQLYLHQTLRTLNEDYKKYSDINEHVLFKETPLSQKNTNNNVTKVEDVEFPLSYDVNFFCRCCDSSNTKKLTIEDREDIKRVLDYEFEGFLHSTYMKWYDVIQAITIHHLRDNIGDEQLRKVHKYFARIYPKMNLPVKSGGEKLYEELTGFSFE